MNDLIVKIVSEYSSSNPNTPPNHVTKTRIFSTDRVDVDEFDEYWLVTIGDADYIERIDKNIVGDEWQGADGITTAIYVENERGKTTHAVRSFVMLGNPLEPEQEAILSQKLAKPGGLRNSATAT